MREAFSEYYLTWVGITFSTCQLTSVDAGSFLQKARGTSTSYAIFTKLVQDMSSNECKFFYNFMSFN